jgi:hypothetical protein
VPVPVVLPIPPVGSALSPASSRPYPPSSTLTLHGLEPHKQTSSSPVLNRTQGRIPLHVIQHQEFHSQHHPRNTSRFDGGRTSETAALPVSLTSNWLQYSYLCVSELTSNVARLLPATPARTPSGTLWLRESLHLNSHLHRRAPLAAPPSILLLP